MAVDFDANRRFSDLFAGLIVIFKLYAFYSCIVINAQGRRFIGRHEHGIRIRPQRASFASYAVDFTIIRWDTSPFSTPIVTTSLLLIVVLPSAMIFGV